MHSVVAANAEKITQSPDNDAAEGIGGRFPIVGIGMSAGGLEVATAFLNAMPSDSGMGFVIVQHLDPTRESMLADLLSRETEMPVVQIEEGMRVEPNRVHIIVPAKTLLIRDGVLQLVEPEAPRGQRHPIDAFFSSLAVDQKAKAIAIVLSGAGSNGTAGLADIKQAGGLCIAQDPEFAKFDSMPRHAVASGMVDLVLAPGDIPQALIEYAQHSYVEAPQPEMLEGPGKDGSGPGLYDVLTLLHSRAGHDFSQYKHNTLSRRVHRRMGLARLEKLADYLALLIADPDEAGKLAKDLLIHVTAFFRDTEAWDALDREVITPMVEQAEAGQSIRVWVPACSTGEEAYTIAMILAERSAACNKALQVKIFATDAAEHHLSTARRATFPGSMVESLSAERITRFFDKIDDNYYRIKPEIRETVLFAPQNLLTDPPYSRMDLVSCRNLLIYLEPAAQDKVLSLAHFALRENGYLFLGNAESIGQREHHFASVSKRWRIYRRIGPPRSGALDFSQWPVRDAPAVISSARSKPSDVAVKVLAERFAPASVLIDRNYCVLHFHGSTDDYLTQPAGAPTMDLLALAREGLRMTVRRAVRAAMENAHTITLRVAFKTKAGDGVLVTAGAVGEDSDTGLILVSFALDQGADPTLSLQRAPINVAQDGGLEIELLSAREEMRFTVQQYEAANEELTAANEEVTSINEELQATNEELESSKEELQSLNEELTSVNAELDSKIAELAEAGDDLRNLLDSNEIATIFLDRELCIKWFSPAIRGLFDLIEKDIGRPIANFTQKFAFGDLLENAQAAIAHLTISEVEVRADDGRCLLLRVLPYRSRDDRIAGAVASFIDITDLKSTQSKIAEARDYAEAIVETVRDPLMTLSGDLRVRSANPAFFGTFGLAEADTIGRRVYELADGRWNFPELRTLLEDVLPEHRQIDDYEIGIEVPHLGVRCMLLNARCITGEDDEAEFILLAIEDITERRNSDKHQELLVGELSHRVKNTLAVVQSIAVQTLRHSDTLETFGEAFQGRLQALAGANDAIIDGSWKGVTLKHTIERGLRPFGADHQIVLADGPEVDLRPQACLALTMILHELATNAVKYGALSVPEGLVSITWQIDPPGKNQSIRIDWAESNGPAVEKPTRLGQGTRFIERSCAYELKGKANVTFSPGGLQASLVFPSSVAIMPVGKSPPALTDIKP